MSTLANLKHQAVLVTVASRHGSTAEIATRIGVRLREGLPSSTWHVDIVNVDEVGSVNHYDAIVLGSAIYLGQWLKSARNLLRRVESPPRLGMWLFSSGPVEPDSLVTEVEVSPDSVEAHLGVRNNTVFPGRLDIDSLGRFERAAISAMHATGGDFRDWGAIDAWAQGITRELLSATHNDSDDNVVNRA